MSAIILEPTPAPGALVEAIVSASQSNRPLLLAPGVHFTTPGPHRRIPIGATGLTLGAAASCDAGRGAGALIRRPERSIDALTPDDNYGLFFVPAPPTPEEVAEAHWKVHADAQGAFDFAVVMRGSIDLAGLEIDCNMATQGLESLPKNVAEHSAMLGFAGQRYAVSPGAAGGRRFVYVGFERVSLANLLFSNGGFADDVWFTRGYFHPNIERVTVRDVVSRQRVNPRRATLSFSGLSQAIEIENADIYSLHLEELSEPWSEQPRRDEVFEPSRWTLSHVSAERLSLAAKGHSFKVTANDITASEQFGIYQADGTISNSRLRVMDDDRRLFRLQTMLFDGVTWYLPANAEGKVAGLRPTPQYGDPCFVEFRNNRFVVEGDFASGQLVDGEYSRAEPKNHVSVVCRGCQYPESFATEAFPNTHIARAGERGTWVFEAADFQGRAPAQAVVKGAAADILVELV